MSRRRRRASRHRHTVDEDEDFRSVMYSINVFGRNVTLAMDPYAEFIGGTYRLDFAGVPDADLKRRTRSRGPARHCFYRGLVDGQENHEAVVSICNGMVSVVVLFGLAGVVSSGLYLGKLHVGQAAETDESLTWASNPLPRGRTEFTFN